MLGVPKIALAVGGVIDKHKIGTYPGVDITGAPLSFVRKAAVIAAEAVTDVLDEIEIFVGLVLLDADQHRTAR